MTATVRSSSKPLSRLKRLAGIAIAAFAAAVLATGIAATPAMAAITPTYDENTWTATVNATKDYTVSHSEYITCKSDIAYAGPEFTRSYKFTFTNNTKYYVTLWAEGQITKGNYNDYQWWYKIPEHTTMWSLKSTGSQMQKVFTVDLAPGETCYYYAVDKSFGVAGAVSMRMYYKSLPERLLNYQEKPDLKVTKLSANEAAVRVKLPLSEANVKDVTQIKVYAGSKLIKSFKSKSGAVKMDADGYYKFRYAKSGAGTAKYSAVATTVAKPSDTATSATVKPAANKATLKVSKKLADYSKATTIISSLSYSGGKLVVKGYTVNPYPAALNGARSVEIVHTLNNQRISSYKNMSFSKGFKAFTLKFSTKKVIDLKDRHDYLVGSQPPVFA